MVSQPATWFADAAHTLVSQSEHGGDVTIDEQSNRMQSAMDGAALPATLLHHPDLPTAGYQDLSAGARLAHSQAKNVTASRGRAKK